MVPHEMRNHVQIFIPKFLSWVNRNKITQIDEQPRLLKLSDPKIFDFPLLFITGHYDFTLTDQEKQNLKAHLERGGFLYIEDCGGTDETLQQYGRFSTRIKSIVKELFPGADWRILPKDHEIYQFPFKFPNGLPNIVGKNNDVSTNPNKKRKAQGGEGFYERGRMIAFYSDADTCCAWDWDGKGAPGEIPYQVGANIVVYAMTH